MWTTFSLYHHTNTAEFSVSFVRSEVLLLQFLRQFYKKFVAALLSEITITHLENISSFLSNRHLLIIDRQCWA